MTIAQRIALVSCLALAPLLATGCFVGLRGGPAVQSGDLDFKGVGWTFTLSLGVQYDFGKLRLAGVGGVSATKQDSGGGKVSERMGVGGIEGDWTLRDWLWKRNRARCGANVGGIGARWRAGAGYRWIGAPNDKKGGTITPANMPEVPLLIDSGWSVEADTEIGIYLGKFGLYGGAGVEWRHVGTEASGDIDSFQPFVQVAMGYNLFIPHSLTVLMSHYGAVQAREEQAAWGRIDCTNARDPALCEQRKSEQVSAWGDETVNQQEQGARMRAACAEH